MIKGVEVAGILRGHNRVVMEFIIMQAKAIKQSSISDFKRADFNKVREKSDGNPKGKNKTLVKL